MGIAAEEDIVRAICTDKWDGQRLAPSLFTGENTSVSRLALIPLEDHWPMFRDHVQKPPERLLALIGEINVGTLQKLGETHHQPVELSVESVPEDWNRAHAEIRGKVTKGLANRILKELKLHHPPPGGY